MDEGSEPDGVQDTPLFCLFYGKLCVRIWTPPVLQALLYVRFGYDSTRISGLPFERKLSAIMGYSRVCSLSV